MAAMPEANDTALPDSSPPTTSSSASQVGVPSSRAYSRPLPMMKFDEGISGTFSGAPGSEARPAEMSHDSGLIPDGCFANFSNASRQGELRPERLDQEKSTQSNSHSLTDRRSALG